MKTFFETKSTSDFKSSKDFLKFYKLVVKTKISHDNQQIASIIYPSSNLSNSEPVDIANTFGKFFTSLNSNSNSSLEESKYFINRKFIDYKRTGTLCSEVLSFKKFSECEVLHTLKCRQ